MYIFYEALREIENWKKETNFEFGFSIQKYLRMPLKINRIRLSGSVKKESYYGRYRIIAVATVSEP